MRNYILTTSSLILCPHGGPVTHIPSTQTDFRINGEPLMLLSDTYLFSCPGGYHGPGLNCQNISFWIEPSHRLFVRGMPALHNLSMGMINTTGGIMMGQAIITSHQMDYQEPVEVTNVD